MAAFVRRLPGMIPTQYRALAYGPAGPIIAGEAATLAEALPDCAAMPTTATRIPADMIEPLARYRAQER